MTRTAAGRIAILWAMVVVWLVSRALHLPLPMAVAGVLLANLAPGLALLRVLGFGGRGLTWRLFGGGVLSPPLIAATAFVAGLAGPRPEQVTWPLIIAALLVLSVPVRARTADTPEPGDSALERRLVAAGAALAGIVALAFLHPLLLRWSDSWFHVAVFNEVVRVGVHPGFPHFADMPLPYPWFFHVYLAAVRGVVHPDPFVIMATLNEWSAFLLCLGAYTLARALGLSARPAAWSAVAVFFGVNPFGALLFLLRLLIGKTGGESVLRFAFSSSDNIMSALAWNFPSFQTAWLSRLWTPTAFNFALMLGVFILAVLAEHWRAPRWRTFALFVIALGLLLHWHTLTALNLTLGIAAGVALAAISLVPTTGFRPLLAGAVVAAGVGLAYVIARPYLSLVTLGGSSSVVHWALSRPNLFGLVLSLGPLVVASLFSVRGLPRETRLLAAGLALGLVVPLLMFDLPGMAEEKLFYPLELVLAAVAGLGLERAARGPWYARVALWTTLAFSAMNVLLTGAGFLADPHSLRSMFDARHESVAPLYTHDEDAALAWIRERSPRDAVFLQPRRPQGTEPILVHGLRRLWLGPAEIFYSAIFFDTGGRPPIPPRVWAELQLRDSLQVRAFSPESLSAAQIANLRGRPWPVFVWSDTLLSHGILSPTLGDSTVAREVFRSPSVRILEVARPLPAR